MHLPSASYAADIFCILLISQLSDPVLNSIPPVFRRLLRPSRLRKTAGIFSGHSVADPAFLIDQEQLDGRCAKVYSNEQTDIDHLRFLANRDCSEEQPLLIYSYNSSVLHESSLEISMCTCALPSAILKIVNYLVILLVKVEEDHADDSEGTCDQRYPDI